MKPYEEYEEPEKDDFGTRLGWFCVLLAVIVALRIVAQFAGLWIMFSCIAFILLCGVAGLFIIRERDNKNAILIDKLAEDMRRINNEQ